MLSKFIAGAITQFYGDYGKLPVPAGQTAGSLDLTADTSEKSGLIRILLGKEADGPSKQNIRNINYLEGMKAARRGQAHDGPKWIGGLITEDGECAAVDGWGNFFQVRLDTNGDRAVENSNPDEIRDGRLILQNKVLIWCSGKDHREETWSDNIKSWD
ncbi:MAG: hypothetical protein V4726_18205 [Verrucomicrobiota bacterium]